MWVMRPDGTFDGIGNRADSSSNEGTNANAGGTTWPYSSDIGGSQQNNLRDNIDGTLPFLPIIIEVSSPNHVMGELDGVLWTTGFGNTVEAITKLGQIDYISIPNVMRTAINSWCAIALD
jgi:hypothetical protein